MRLVDRFMGAAAAAATLAGIVALSHAPVPEAAPTRGLLRLAWRARPERIERCVSQPPDVLASLPAHMRQPLVCEGVNAAYALDVSRDGVPVASVPVRPGGWRADRPLYVFEELPMPAGSARITVTFRRVDEPEGRPANTPSSAEALTEAVPATLVFERLLVFSPGQVRLISYDPERRTLYEVTP